MRELVEPSQRDARDARDARETLEPMLDDLARGLGYDRAIVLEHDATTATLRGRFGVNVRDEQARALVVGLTRADDPLVVALRTGAPQLVEDVAADTRLDPEQREALISMGI